MFLEGERIYLRAMEPSDLQLLYRWENHPEVWPISEIPQPFSKLTLKAFIQSAHEDIFTSRQMRLMIAHKETQKVVGIIDIFEFDPLHLRAGIGIIIAPKYRNQKFATDAIELVKNYLFNHLFLHQIFCHIEVTNTISRSLFKSCGFTVSGKKTEWKKTKTGFTDVLFLQCVEPKSM